MFARLLSYSICVANQASNTYQDPFHLPHHIQFVYCKQEDSRLSGYNLC